MPYNTRIDYDMRAGDLFMLFDCFSVVCRLTPHPGNPGVQFFLHFFKKKTCLSLENKV